ncbi:alpha/beta hydrolase-fold protein [Rufibacter aurantiacus]|uniref:alpha/beta hydrolase-fold protein n=1 Tax=Rufibacter aurantiacus TaxID=2817374 RepID=UPI001B314A16|nr:alpha/beta hydrolase-fold protein [Rufibacter aurantiacus]
MARAICILLWLITFSMAYGQAGRQIVIGVRDTVASKVLNEKRGLLVHLPMTEPDVFSPDQKYPVIYVLDGDGSLFYSVVAITEGLSGGSGNFMFPKMIVVGIPNTDRTRDLTPTYSTDSTVMPGFLLANSGGGEKFLSFFQRELIPHIETHYPAAPYRVIIGHSFGGLTVLNALVNHRGLFNSFVAIDPSMWWDNLRYSQALKTALRQGTFANKALYVAIANSMEKKFTLQTVTKDQTAATLPIRSILDFDKFLKENPKPGLAYRSKFYPDYDHGGVPLVAIYDALPFVFDFFTLNFPFSTFFNPTYKDDGLLINHYQKVSARMGYTVSPPGELVNALAHQLMGTRQFDRAYKLLQLNIDNYPKSYMPYSAMAEYFELKGDKRKAREYYLKSVEIKPLPETKAKLDNLK